MNIPGPRISSRRLVLVAGGFVIAVILAMAVAAVVLLRSQEIESWKKQLASLSLVLAEQTGQTLSATQLALDSIAERVEDLHPVDGDDLRRKAGTAALHEILKERISSLSRADVATIVAANGDVINFTRSFPPPPINLADRDYFQAHRDNPRLGLFISIPVKNKGNGKWVFYSTRRLNDPKGNFIGLVLVGISVDLFTEFFERLGTYLGPGASVALYRDDFSLLTRWPRREALIGKQNRAGTTYEVVGRMGKTDDVILAALPRMTEGDIHQQRMAAIRRVERYPLIVNLTVTTDMVLETWYPALYAISAIALGSVLALALGLVNALRIITRREESAALLRESEERYARAVRGTSDGLWDLDLVAGRDYLSPRLKELLGFAEDESIGRITEFLSRVHPDDAARTRAAIRGHLKDCVPFDIEVRLITRSGDYHWFNVRGEASRDEHGTPVRMSGIIADIAARKDAEAELHRHRDHLEDLVEARTTALSVAKEAAESANRAKTTFLTNMSHELRTPMNAIIGLTHMLARSTSDPTQLDRLGKISQSADHLLEVINDVLDLSKIEAERLTLENAEFHLDELVAQLDNLIGERARAKQLQLCIEMDPRLREQPLLGDPLRLKQVLLNLVGNAVKFTEHGSITLRGGIRSESEHDLVAIFDVTDTGVGIPQDVLGKIFDPFEQADGSTTRRFGGTGLGLSISRRLVRLMGGNISVTSTPGKGSSFIFTVRLGKAGEQAPHPEPVPLSGTDAEYLIRTHHPEACILLVEDDPINQEVAHELLAGVLGMVVDIAGDGIEAVDLARKVDYQLILMDMQMPRMDGVEATRIIREIPGRQHTPIIAMTANAFEEDRQVCLAAGMNDFLSKPVNPDSLAIMLVKWLQTHPATAPAAVGTNT